MQAEDTEQNKVTTESIVQVINIMQKRVNEMGLTEPIIQREGANRIIIELPGERDPQKAIETIGKTAVLEFRDEEGNVCLTGEDLKDAREQIGQNREPLVALQFSKEGGDKFAKLTAANIGRHVGIYLDGDLLTNPVVNDAITGGSAVITGQRTLEEAKDGVKTIMEDKKFGDAGNRMVIEEFMTGREVSVLAFCDGKTIKCMTSAQDHKRAKDGDQGLNTGGMGTFSPSPFYTKEVEEFCEKYIYQPTMDAMAAEGRPFVGILFTGLMLTEDGPKVLEYNARFGDPEAQVVLPRMTNDIIDVMEACIDGRLDEIDLQFEDNAAVCVVLASDGYPVSYKKGYVINGLDEFKKHDGYYCFHAGTKRTGEGIVTNGGRVLGVTAKGSDLKEARKNAYAATEWVTFENKYMRHDIGKAIDDVEA